MHNIWIVVPAFNESKYLGRFLEKLIKVEKNIIVVDDGSRDKTSEIAKKFTKHVLTNPKNRGKGAVMRQGAEYAFGVLNAESVIFMDGDDQHHPEDLQRFIEIIKQKKYDLIFGARRFGSEMPLIRIVGNRIASFLVYFFYGKYIYDIPSGFKAMTKKGFDKVYWHYNDYTVEMEIAVKAIKNKVKFTQTEISTIYHDMDRGMQMDAVWKMGIRVLKWRIFGVK